MEGVGSAACPTVAVSTHLGNDFSMHVLSLCFERISWTWRCTEIQFAVKLMAKIRLERGVESQRPLPFSYNHNSSWAKATLANILLAQISVGSASRSLLFLLLIFLNKVFQALNMTGFGERLLPSIISVFYITWVIKDLKKNTVSSTLLSHDL